MKCRRGPGRLRCPSPFGLLGAVALALAGCGGEIDLVVPCANADAGDAGACAANETSCAGVCVDTQLDVDSCGACANRCPAGEVCSGGACAPTCGGGTTRCGDACRDTTSDPENCGACRNPCRPVAHATSVCAAGTCAYACQAGHLDCNGLAADGCEIDARTDDANCGACGKACDASEVCAGAACTPVVSVSPIGCADGTREAFTDRATFPDIAACAGGWTIPGIFPPPARSDAPGCDASGNSSAVNPNGTGCSAIDLCSPGWHLCRGGEVGVRAAGGCDAATSEYTEKAFYAGAISSTGCNECALVTNTITAGCNSYGCEPGCQANPSLNNDFFGCGSTGAIVAASVCDVTHGSGNLCGALPAGWSCGTNGQAESLAVVHDTTAAGAPEGGVICCR